jgi:hypothetical protein
MRADFPKINNNGKAPASDEAGALHISLIQFTIEPFRKSFNGNKYGQPNRNIHQRKYGGKYHKYHWFKCDPGVCNIAQAIRQVQNRKMYAQGFCDGPMLDLIKNAGPRLNKCQKIRRYHRKQDGSARKGAILHRNRNKEKDNRCHYRAKACENQSAVQK